MINDGLCSDLNISLLIYCMLPSAKSKIFFLSMVHDHTQCDESNVCMYNTHETGNISVSSCKWIRKSNRVWNGIASWGTNRYVVWTSFIADTLLWLRSHCGKADTEQIRTGSNTFQTCTAARYKSRIDGIPHYHKTSTIFPINSNWFLITFPHGCWTVFSSYCRCSNYTLHTP